VLDIHPRNCSKNPLEEITDELFPSLLNTFSSLPSATTTQLSLNSCHLSQSTANRVAELFQQPLEELYLACNQLTTYLPSSLASVAGLKKLDLQGNPIKTCESIWYLGELTQLEFLNLSDCQVGESSFPTCGSFIILNSSPKHPAD